LLCAVVCAVLMDATAGLRTKTESGAVVVTSGDAPAAPTETEVNAERARMERMEAMLASLLEGPGLARSQVAPALKLFAASLHSVLNESKAMKPGDAMQKLTAAGAGVERLVSSLTQRQESLMREDTEQVESLLTGVLMTNRNAPMEKQFEILKSEDFAGLDVSKALLKLHDNKTALYMQVARYLDTHKNAGGAPVSQHRENRVEAMAASLDARVVSLQRDAKRRAVQHKKKREDLLKLVAAGGKNVRMLKAMAKREERNFKKWEARSEHDIKSMKEAAHAVRSGDTKALMRAREALQQSLDALKHKNAGMLVFLQQANAFLQNDCPYCAAQCVEKCHSSGEPYLACLSECADAGK